MAQFARTTNPAFRSTSPAIPQPESTQRQSEEPPEPEEDEMATPQRANSGRPAPLNYRSPEPHVPPNYSPSQHGDVPRVPHNQYPTEGMTMFCRSDLPSAAGSAVSASTRPGSSDGQSEYSNPSSFTSAEPLSGKNSPTKGMPPVNGVELPGMGASSPGKSIQKKRSGFFSNSPFRRKSKKELNNPLSSPPQRDTWNAAPASVSSRNPFNSAQSSPTKSASRQPPNIFNRSAPNLANEGEEPVDPRASFQLNVGNNVFDVASPDNSTTPKANSRNSRLSQFNHAASISPDDPIAQALANLKQGSNGASGLAKEASVRVPVDRYHGVATPAPDQNPASRPTFISAESQARLAAQRGTPPPAYESSGRSQSALGVPLPAHTKREMMDRTQTWGTNNGATATTRGPSRPVSRDGRRSPGPGMIPRATSPQPPSQYHQQQMRARSPGPAAMRQSPSSQGQYRAASPNPYGQTQPVRQGSGMEMQLSSQDVTRYDSGSGRRREAMRPTSSYGGASSQQGFDSRGRPMEGSLGRQRSKSMANVPMMPRGGAPQPLHYGKETQPNGVK